jgi:hypothetical protein
MSLKDRVIENINKMLALEETKNAEMEKALKKGFTEVANGVHVAITPEQNAANANAIRDEYNKRIMTIQEELQQTVDAAEKKANQDYYKALKTPTADERAEIEHIKSVYNNTQAMQRDSDFASKRDFHLKNETVKAFVYCVASCEIYGVDEMPDEWLKIINPEVLEKREEMADVLEAKRLVEIYGLYQMKDSESITQVQKIAIKSRLYELGANPNATRFQFI